MKSFARLVLLVLVMALLSISFGCGGGGTAVQVTAKQVAEQPATVAVNVAEDAVSLGAGESYQFTATVTGHSNTAVTWNLSGCSGTACGTISPTGLYTAPSAILTEATVTITATSQADPTKSDTVAVRHRFIAVRIAPPGTVTLYAGATLNFAAIAQYDVDKAGVTWALAPAYCAVTCGTLSNVTQNSVTYTAPTTVPGPPTVTLTATSITDTSKTAEVAIVVSIAALKEGDYAFFFNGWEAQISGSAVVVAGHFHADAYGNITDGVEDINEASGVSRSVPFTGSYGVGPDGRGSFTIVTAQGTATYHMAVDSSNEKGKFIKFDGLPINVPISGTGYFELQDKAAFSLSALAGPYAIGTFGKVETNDIAAVGRFTAGTDGAFSSGRMDITMLSSLPESFTNLALTGSFGAPSSSTGRGTATVTLTPPPGGAAGTFNFAYYVISDQKILLVQTDTRSSTIPVLSGLIQRQNGSFSVASFNAPTIFSLAGETWFGSTAAIGRIVPDGLGSMAGIIDENAVAITDATVLNEAFRGTYAVDADGRSTMNLVLGSGVNIAEIAYFFGQNEGFLMQTSAAEVAFGSFKPQSAGPFTAASISGSFFTNTAVERIAWWTDNYSGLTTFDGTSAVTSSMDISCWGCSRFDFSGTYDVATNGRGTLLFTSPSPNRAIVFWIISPTELVSIATVNRGDDVPVLLEYKK